MEVSQEKLKKLEDMSNAGGSEAAKALSKMIGQEVKTRKVIVRVVPIEEVADSIGQAEDVVTAVVMGVSGGVRGSILVIYPQQSALNLADLMGKRTLGSTRRLSDLDQSSLKESGNIIAGAFFSAVSNIAGINMVESVPDLATDMLDAVVSSALAKFASSGGEAGAAVAATAAEAGSAASVGAGSTSSTSGEAIAFEVNFGLGTEARAAERVIPKIGIELYFVLLLSSGSAQKIIDAMS